MGSGDYGAGLKNSVVFHARLPRHRRNKVRLTDISRGDGMGRRRAMNALQVFYMSGLDRALCEAIVKVLLQRNKYDKRRHYGQNDHRANDLPMGAGRSYKIKKPCRDNL
jgi:hypothetical protein